MTDSTSVERYSTIADFELRTPSGSYRPAQVSSKFIIMERPVDIPPCEADLFIRVEGEETHRRIRLPQGASAESDWVEIERLSEDGAEDVASLPKVEPLSVPRSP